MLQMTKDTKLLVRKTLKLVFAWAPLIVGIVHQFFMLSGGPRRIYVFLKPPEYIEPIVTLTVTWWIMLLLGSGVLTLLLATNRIRNTRYRVLYPYAYFVFLLIFVEPK